MKDEILELLKSCCMNHEPITTDHKVSTLIFTNSGLDNFLSRVNDIIENHCGTCLSYYKDSLISLKFRGCIRTPYTVQDFLDEISEDVEQSYKINGIADDTNSYVDDTGLHIIILNS